MPGFSRLLMRRAGPVGLVMTAWDIWRRIPPKHRQRIMEETRKHGPRIAKQVMQRRPRR